MPISLGMANGQKATAGGVESKHYQCKAVKPQKGKRSGYGSIHKFGKAKTER